VCAAAVTSATRGGSSSPLVPPTVSSPASAAPRGAARPIPPALDDALRRLEREIGP
jgi:hypothetical protein